MKKQSLLVPILMMFALAALELSAQPQQPLDVAGTWLGTLKIGVQEMRIVFRVLKKSDNSWTAVIDSPDQGAKDIPTSSVVLEGDRLIIEAKQIGGVFAGKVKPDGQEIEGSWKQGGADFPLVLKRTDKVEEPKRPQEPKKPYPYREEEVVYENKKAGIKLAGTLTLPSAAGRYPAVILISGSGPEDRNETVSGHRPFLVLADALTRRGIAVLRVDDRGVGGSTGVESQSTSLDFAGDVLSGVAYLRSRPEIQPGQIGLIGHSEGGLIAPLAASMEPASIAFIVLLAGPGLPGEEILYLQGGLIAKASGASQEEMADNLAVQKKLFAVVKQEKDPAALEGKLRQVMTEAVAAYPPEKQKAFPPQVQEAQIKFLISPWFRFFLTYDPRPALGKVRCPVLALNGQKDLQVPPQENLKAIVRALETGGNKRYLTQELAGLNHLFQTASTGSPAEYVTIEETMAPAVLLIISDWILNLTQSKRT